MPQNESTIRIQAAWQRLARLATLPAVDERIRQGAGISLSRPERAVLAQLRDQGSLRISELAHLVGVDVSTMSRTLRRLADAGYIDRRPGTDLRAVRVSLTHSGQEALAQLLSAGQAMLSEILSTWPIAEREELAELMSRFAEAFGEYVSPASNAKPIAEVRG